MKNYFDTKEQCESAIESLAQKTDGVYIQEGVFRIGDSLYAAEQEYNKEKGCYEKWYIKKETEKYPYTLHFDKSFLTIGELKQIIEDEEIPDDTIISFSDDRFSDKIRLCENYSYDYLICNKTSQPLPIDDIGELESRRYRGQMVLKLS